MRKRVNGRLAAGWILCLMLMAGLMLALAGCGSNSDSGLPKGVLAAGESTGKNASGEAISWKNFTASDLDGNVVDQGLFSQADLTVVNIWMTSCGPCIRELGSLKKLAQTYEDQNVQVVGIVLDVLNEDRSISEERVEAVKMILEKTQTDYLQLTPSEDLIQIRLSKVFGTPETVFVDGEGNEIGSVMGAKSYEQWTSILEQHLKKL